MHYRGDYLMRTISTDYLRLSLCLTIRYLTVLDGRKCNKREMFLYITMNAQSNRSHRSFLRTTSSSSKNLLVFNSINLFPINLSKIIRIREAIQGNISKHPAVRMQFDVRFCAFCSVIRTIPLIIFNIRDICSFLRRRNTY